MKDAVAVFRACWFGIRQVIVMNLPESEERYRIVRGLDEAVDNLETYVKKVTK